VLCFIAGLKALSSFAAALSCIVSVAYEYKVKSRREANFGPAGKSAGSGHPVYPSFVCHVRLTSGGGRDYKLNGRSGIVPFRIFKDEPKFGGSSFSHSIIFWPATRAKVLSGLYPRTIICASQQLNKLRRFKNGFFISRIYTVPMVVESNFRNGRQVEDLQIVA